MEGLGALERRLRIALAEGSLLLRYQPVVALASGEVEELRAMLRWPGGGGITPEQLIDIARFAGVLPELHRWILRTACAEGVRWGKDGVAAAVGVTVGSEQILDGTVPTDVADALDSSGLPCRLLHVGLPVSALAVLAEPAALLADLGRLGVSVGVVGVRGWPLPDRLRPTTIDWLGLDRNLVEALAELPVSRAARASVIALVADHRARTVAAGVETDRELSCVEILGVTHALGYRFAPPTAAPELGGLLRRMQGEGSGRDGSFGSGQFRGTRP